MEAETAGNENPNLAPGAAPGLLAALKRVPLGTQTPEVADAIISAGEGFNADCMEKWDP